MTPLERTMERVRNWADDAYQRGDAAALATIVAECRDAADYVVHHLAALLDER